jgi:UDP-glucose 4-epimerase
MSRSIFISGVAGFLGSHLAEAFLSNGDDVVGLDNLIGGYRDNVPEGVKFYEGDCNNLELLQSIFRNHRIEIVYHTACTAYEGLSVFSPKLITENTFGATVSMLTASISNDVSRFIQLSSMARYGAQDITPFLETMTPRPQDPYGIAKYAAELIIEELCTTHGMEYVIAVPHNIIGPRQKYDDPFRNVASIMINLMLQGRQPYIYGDGTQERCFSFINDVVTPLLKLSTLNTVRSEVINIGPDEGTTTINNLALEIGKILNFEVNPIYMPGRPREVKFATCSADKARNLLDYKTTYSLSDGLRDMIEYIQKRGVKEFDYHLPLEILSPKLPRTWKDRLF